MIKQRFAFTGRILLAVAALTLTGCSTLDPFFANSTAYRKFLRKKIVQEKRYDRGSLLVSAKVLTSTPELKEQQEKLVPGFAFPYDPARAQIIVALSLASDEVFRKNGLLFYLNGHIAKDFKEETQKPLIESLYHFGYPFHRVLYVNFGEIDVSGPQTLRILTPQGPVEASITF